MLSCQRSCWLRRCRDNGLSLMVHLLNGLACWWLSLLHAHIVATWVLEFSQHLPSAVPKVLQLYSFWHLARPAFLWMSGVCGRSAFSLSRWNFQIRLFFPMLFHQLSPAGGKPGMIPRPLLWAKRYSGSSTWKASTAGESCDVDFVPYS